MFKSRDEVRPANRAVRPKVEHTLTTGQFWCPNACMMESEFLASTDFFTVAPGHCAHGMYHTRSFMHGGYGENALYTRWLTREPRF